MHSYAQEHSTINRSGLGPRLLDPAFRGLRLPLRLIRKEVAITRNGNVLILLTPIQSSLWLLFSNFTRSKALLWLRLRLGRKWIHFHFFKPSIKGRDRSWQEPLIEGHLVFFFIRGSHSGLTLKGCTFVRLRGCSVVPWNQVSKGLGSLFKEATSRCPHLEKLSLNFSSSSFYIRVNLLHP